MRILIVEDEPSLSEAIASFLKTKGHTVDIAPSIKAANLSVATVTYSLVLLDLMLPDGSGLDFLKLVRHKKFPTGVLIMTAKDQISDRILGLESGADDYLLKPFDLNEMYARIQAVYRRYLETKDQSISIHGYSINAEKKFISYQDNEIILTAKEWAILERIIESPKSTVTKAALENSLYAFDDDISSNTIEVYISQIRKKTCKEIIVTVRGIGYRLGQND